ncbi:MAG: hypothetical protein EXR72_04020 [Myxococcales bacterium]|nr:hypothetical protein [Myxococcales bacterium]
MSRLCCALLLLASPSLAVEPTRASGTTANAAQRVTESLPASIALLDITLPERLARMRADGVAVSWLAAPRPGTQSVTVTLRTGGREVAKGFARVELAPLRRVLVARRDLTAGAAIANGDLAVEDRAVRGGADRPLDPAALAGATLNRSILAGSVVDADAIALSAPLPQGTPLKLIVRRGGAVITLAGLLERPARPGELAGARIPGDRRLVRGRLSDRTTLVVGGEMP